MLTDFHVHSDFSDGKHSISDLVDFYGKRGFGAIAITDHVCESKTILGKAAKYLDRTLTPENFPLYLETIEKERERAWSIYAMHVMAGVEITKNSFSNQRSAHVLGLGITKWISPDDDIRSTLQNVHRQGGLTIAAHPVSNGKFEKQTLHLWDYRHDYADLFDAWEVASGPIVFQAVKDSGLPLIASSDLHRFSQINAWKTEIQCEKRNDAIFEAIRKQRLNFRFYRDPSASEEAVPFSFRPSLQS